MEKNKEIFLKTYEKHMKKKEKTRNEKKKKRKGRSLNIGE